jgi:hypothetical protein
VTQVVLLGHVIDNDRMRVFASFYKKKGFLFFFEKKKADSSLERTPSAGGRV